MKKCGIILLILAIAGSVGSYLFLHSSWYQCRKNIKLADACIQQEEYDKALAYCEAALELDTGYADAYLREADSYLAMESYGAAAAALQKGIENVAEKDNGRLSDKLEKVYQTEAKKLIGTWKFNAAELYNLPGEVDEFLEFYDNGTLSVSIDKDAVSKMVGGVGGGLWDAVGEKFSWMVPFLEAGGSMVEWYSGALAGVFGTANFTYTTQGEMLCLQKDKETTRTCSFTIKGDTLLFTEEIPKGEDCWISDFTLELKRVK